MYSQGDDFRAESTYILACIHQWVWCWQSLLQGINLAIVIRETAVDNCLRVIYALQVPRSMLHAQDLRLVLLQVRQKML